MEEENESGPGYFVLGLFTGVIGLLILMAAYNYFGDLNKKLDILESRIEHVDNRVDSVRSDLQDTKMRMTCAGKGTLRSCTYWNID